MTLDLKHGLSLWAAALLGVLVLIVPLSLAARLLAMALVLAGLLVLWWYRVRRQAREAATLVFAPGSALPPANFTQPVVLVCGDGLQGLFGDLPAAQIALRTIPHGCYVRVCALEQLPLVVAGLLAQRPEWGAQLSVLLVVNPSEHSDSAQLDARLRTFCYQLGLARRSGCALPVLLASYLQGGRSAGPWFSWEAGTPGVSVREAGHCSNLLDWQRQDPAVQGDRLRTSVRLDSFASWMADTLLPHFNAREARHATAPPVACAVTWALPAAVGGNQWQQWMLAASGLNDARPPVAGARQLPFPDALLQLLPAHAGHKPRHRAAVAALWMFAAAALLAMSSSAWQNHLLVRQVTDELQRVESFGAEQSARRTEAMAVLREEAQRLDDHYRHGTPMALGLGLYRGAPLRAPVHAAIASDAAAPAPLAPTRDAISVRLDSLSLFSPGSAELKPGSEKVLINVLVSVKAQPGRLIVIAGHTDITGNAELNLTLSRARAIAVRDWLQRMGDIHASCFAVQGFGASQPLASNETEIGRAQNRRVDIRLVPEVGACLAAVSAAGGHKPVASSDVQ